MPINQIKINNAIEYYVVDSKMQEVIMWLDNNSVKPRDAESNEQDED